MINYQNDGKKENVHIYLVYIPGVFKESLFRGDVLLPGVGILGVLKLDFGVWETLFLFFFSTTAGVLTAFNGPLEVVGRATTLTTGATLTAAVDLLETDAVVVVSFLPTVAVSSATFFFRFNLSSVANLNGLTTVVFFCLRTRGIPLPMCPFSRIFLLRGEALNANLFMSSKI